MKAYLKPEHELFRTAVQEFSKREAPIEAVRDWDENKIFPYNFFRKLGKQGWLGMNLPQEYGGGGADVFYEVILDEELAQKSYELGAGTFLFNMGLANLIKFGSETQKQKYIPDGLKGMQIFAISITEPNSGSDAASLSLKATRDRDCYVLNGSKMFCSGAHLDNALIMLAARTTTTGRKQEGITVFLIPNSTEGLEIRTMDTLGRRLNRPNELYLTDCRVPVSSILGELDQGWRVLVSHLELERLGQAAWHLGLGQGTYDIVFRHAKTRVQFGGLIGSFQAIRHMLVDMYTKIQAARALTYSAAWVYQNEARSLKEVSLAKMFASEMAQDVTRMGMQILGGYSQLAEYDVVRLFKDATVGTIGGGTSQIQRNIIARELGL